VCYFRICFVDAYAAGREKLDLACGDVDARGGVVVFLDSPLLALARLRARHRWSRCCRRVTGAKNMLQTTLRPFQSSSFTNLSLALGRGGGFQVYQALNLRETSLVVIVCDKTSLYQASPSTWGTSPDAASGILVQVLTVGPRVLLDRRCHACREPRQRFYI
jgi:hypothetical protein